jgi:hypothetical protein
VKKATDFSGSKLHPWQIQKISKHNNFTFPKEPGMKRSSHNYYA